MPPCPSSPSHRYMKYLYPYECEKRGLSNPNELQAAIDSNRREGRRQSFGGSLFAYSPGGAHSMLSSPKLPVSSLGLATSTNGSSITPAPKIKKGKEGAARARGLLPAPVIWVVGLVPSPLRVNRLIDSTVVMEEGGKPVLMAGITKQLTLFKPHAHSKQTLLILSPWLAPLINSFFFSSMPRQTLQIKHKFPTPALPMNLRFPSPLEAVINWACISNHLL